MALKQQSPVVRRPVDLDVENASAVLGGMVATVNSDGSGYTWLNGSTSAKAMGLFGIDAAGDPLESNRPSSHGKITLISLGYHEVDVYEKFEGVAGETATEITYQAGMELRVSDNGKLTGDATTAGVISREVIAIVESVDAESSFIVIKLLA